MSNTAMNNLQAKLNAVSSKHPRLHYLALLAPLGLLGFWYPGWEVFGVFGSFVVFGRKRNATTNV